MAQIIKWGALAAAVAVVLALAASIINMMYPTEIISNFGSAVTNVLSVVGGFFTNVRGALNYVLGSSLPLTICLAFWIGIPIARVGYKVAIAVFRFVNQ